jgi:ABC-type branched-subunit amino acid transport system substrate-binding protein
VWPTSLKIVAAAVVGSLMTAVAMVQWVPDELQTTANAGSGSGSFVLTPGDGDQVAGDDAAGTVGGTTRTGGGGGGGSVEGAGDDAASSDGDAGAGTAAGGFGAGGARGQSGGGGGVDDPTGGGKLECKAGKNGGDTDTGVTANKIRLAANVVTSGAGANFLDQSPDGMQAVVRRYNNKQGGICGRTIDLKLVNDAWEAARGHTNIKTFIREGYFALPVNPSSEGLSSAIQAGDIAQAGIPVIGTDGMRKEQYDAAGKAAWVAPVATATVSQVRIMADYAYSKGARKFGIVYDKVYKFGVEGADAYEQFINTELKRRDSDVVMKKRMAIEPLRPKYQTEANQFLGACGDCDLVVLLLEPETGKTWMSAMGNPQGMTVMGAQPLFNDKFAGGCGSVCNGVWVWTGYNPAIGSNRSKADIARFISEVKEVNPSADETNQFLMGAYLGMEVFLKLVSDCSPNLTRDCIKRRLEGKTFPGLDPPSFTWRSDLVSDLKWTEGNHFANIRARGYTVAYDGPRFTGFKDEATGPIADPTPGVVPN